MDRRTFLKLTGMSTLGALGACSRPIPVRPSLREAGEQAQTGSTEAITIFLCGDVMTGRGIDQALPHPSDPRIHEPYMSSARGYLELAERENGPIDTPVEFGYVWGDALAELERVSPDVRIINLETAVTTSDRWRPKGINYRMHPANVPCLAAARIDCCVLANNHVLDWGERGLEDTLQTLQDAGIAASGAGRSISEAAAPATMEIPGKGRVLVFAWGVDTSGVPPQWAATESSPGVNFLPDLSDREVAHIVEQVREVHRPGDVVVASIHWGSNWGYRIPRRQQSFAHKLIEHAGVDVVYGHSSHHVKGIEVHQERPIMYGCGDFLNDYEGIAGHEQYHDELGLMYFLTVDPTSGRLLALRMTPTRIRRLRVNRASLEEAQWLRDVLDREGEPLGTSAVTTGEGTLALQW